MSFTMQLSPCWSILKLNVRVKSEVTDVGDCLELGTEDLR